jgi:exosortase
VIRAVLLALTLALAAAAYRDLIEYDPFRGARIREFSDAWFFAPTVASPRTVVALALAILFFRARRNADREPSRGSDLAGAALLALCAASGVLAHASGAPRLLGLSLAAALAGASMLVIGRGGFAVAWPSACLALFAAPIPGVVVQAVMLPLQLFTADATVAVLRLLGKTASAVADTIYTPDRTFRIIEVCSGLRAMQSLTLGAFSVFLGPLARPPLRSTVLIACAPLIATIANVLRCVAIVLDPSSDVATAHAVQGWSSFAAGAVALALVDRALSAPAAPPAARVRANGAAGPLRWAALPLALAVTAAASAWPEPTAPAPEGPSLHDLVTPQLGDWSSESIKFDRQFYGSVAFSDRVTRRYARPGDRESIELLAGVDYRETPELSALSPKTRLPGAVWWVEERSARELPGVGAGERLTLRAPNGERWVGYHWRSGTRAVPIEMLWSWLALDRGPLRRERPLVVVRIATPARPSAEAAEARLAAFAPVLDRALARLAPDSEPRAPLGSFALHADGRGGR